MSQSTVTPKQLRFNNCPCSDRSRLHIRCANTLGLQALLCLIILLTVVPLNCFAGERTTVIFPDVTDPYRGVFETILEGISTDNQSQIQPYPLPKNYRPEELQVALQRNRSDGIITLGKRGYLAVKQLNTDIPTVSGALSIVPNGISGISLSADPDALFSHLKSLSPDSKRVFVVYSEKNTGWLMPLAQEAASKYDLELRTYPADDLRAAMYQYRNLLEEARGKNDAIWLPLDKVTTNDDVVLPLLLQSAWDKDLIIISNKPSHAKRGALFAMYPDNHGLGQELALLLDQLTETPETSKVIPLKRLNLAVNLRTAAHLGLNFTPSQQEDFKVTFPSR